MRFRRNKNKHPIHYDLVLEKMEERYKDKIPKHGDSWRDCDRDFYKKRIITKLEEVNDPKLSEEEKITKATDLANFATMLLAVELGQGRACPKGYVSGRAFRSMGG